MYNNYITDLNLLDLMEFLLLKIDFCCEFVLFHEIQFILFILSNTEAIFKLQKY